MYIFFEKMRFHEIQSFYVFICPCQVCSKKRKQPVRWVIHPKWKHCHGLLTFKTRVVHFCCKKNKTLEFCSTNETLLHKPARDEGLPLILQWALFFTTTFTKKKCFIEVTENFVTGRIQLQFKKKSWNWNQWEQSEFDLIINSKI